MILNFVRSFTEKKKNRNKYLSPKATWYPDAGMRPRIRYARGVHPVLRSIVLAIQKFAHRAVHDTTPRQLQITGGVILGILVLALAAWLYIRSRRPTPEEIERRRRERLATIGRITDGIILDARSLDGEDSISPTPDILFYSYSLAGVTYNCAQDVSTLPERVRGYRLDQPIQVRYDPRNPGNSILVAESWSGLWQTPPPG